MIATFRALVVGLIAGLAASCAGQNQWTTPLPEVGTKFSSVFEIGGSQVPLPPGEWSLVATTLDRSTGSVTSGTSIQRSALAQSKNGVMTRAIIVFRNLQSAGYGWRREPECDRQDMHFVSSDKNFSSNKTECFWINHRLTTRAANSDSFYTSVLDAAERLSVKFPCTVLTEEFYLVEGRDYIWIIYATNPETAGFPPTASCDWRGNDWHRDRVSQDPKKRAFIDSLRREGESLLPLVKQGFAGQLAAAKLRRPAPIATTAPAAPGRDTAARLRELQRLRDDGLISGAEYDARRQRILDAL